MVISSPSIYIFCRHYSPLPLPRQHQHWCAWIFGAASRGVWRQRFCNSQKVFDCFADKYCWWLTFKQNEVRMSDHRSHLDWMTKLGNWNLARAKIFEAWWKKLQFSSWHFAWAHSAGCHLSLSWPCLGHIPLFALTSVSPKKCGFNRPAVYCRQAFAFSLCHF